MSFGPGWIIRDDRKCWIFVRSFASKKLAKDFLRRFWKQKKHFKLEKGVIWYDN